MEFTWELAADGTFHILDRNHHSWFLQLRPLGDFIPEPPFFAAVGSSLHEDLSAWMRTWAPKRSAPLASLV